MIESNKLHLISFLRTLFPILYYRTIFMKSNLPSIKLNPIKKQCKPNDSLTNSITEGRRANKLIYAVSASSNYTQIHTNHQQTQQSEHSKSMIKLDKEFSSLKSNVYIEKIWLIRKIGDLLNEDNRLLSAKHRRIKRKMHKKYKQFNRDSNKLLNIINEQGNSVDVLELRRLKQSLK